MFENKPPPSTGTCLMLITAKRGGAILGGYGNTVPSVAINICTDTCTNQIVQYSGKCSILYASSLMQVGDLEDSSVYIRMKSKAAAEVGIDVKHLKLSRQVC